MISKNFIKNSTIYTLAGALPMASAIVLLPFYIKYLSADAYGALAICLAFSVFTQILATYSFDSSLYIHYHEFKNDRIKLGTFISSSFVFLAGWGLALIAVLSAIGQVIFDLVWPDSTLSFYPYGLMSIFIGVFQAIGKVYNNLLQTREKPEPFFWSNVISFGVIATLTIVGLQLYPESLLAPLGSRVIATSGVAGWALFKVFREFGVHVKSPWRDTSASFNAFTFVYQIQQWVINYFDRFIILFFMPSAAMASVGIYDIAVKCLAPIELLLNGLNASIFPRIIKLITGQSGKKKSTPEVNRYFYGQISVIMLVICFSILVLPWIIEWFVHKSGYADAIQYLPYIAIIFILRSMRLYFVLPYNIMKKMHRLTFISFGVSAFKIGLMILLILQWNLYGIIIASALAYVLEMILLFLYLRDDYEMKFNAFKLMIGPLTLLLAISLTEPSIGIIYPLFVHAGYCLFCIALLWFSYRKELALINPLKK